MKNNSLLFAGLILLVAANSFALTLGRHRSATLLGQPLDMSVQAALDVQEDLSALCLDADVFYADSRVNKSRIRVTAERASSGSQDAVIRIRSSSLVDEPIVTVYLRVGCQQKVERRYVVLADLASDVVPDRNAASFGAQQLQVLPPLISVPTAVTPTVGLPSVRSSADPVNDSRQKRSRNARKSKKQVDAVSQTAAAPTEESNLDKIAAAPKRVARKSERAQSVAKTSSTNRPRLKLEPLDLTIDRDPQLKSSAQLLSSPASSPQERSAAAALWRAIASQPQDILKELDQLQSLESSVRSLQTQNQKTQQSINELEGKLRKTESERYANVLVYALCFLLLVTLTVLAYLMRERFARRRVSGADTPWWRMSDGQTNPRGTWSDSSAQADSLGKGRSAVVKKKQPEVSAKAFVSEPDIDLNLAHSDLSSPDKNTNLHADYALLEAPKDSSDFALSMSLPARAVKAEELFDVQQQADFFVSIGQHDQAIEVLRAHIADSVETSALVYLDLFNLYHQLQLKDDYAALRGEFNDRFNTEIPVFDMYTDAGPGIEAYKTAMSRIEALWPSSKVLELIEESIFRRPETNAEAFNLEAYRELLMLYSVAKEIISPELKNSSKPKKFDLPETSADTSELRPVDFRATAIQPLSASIDDTLPLHPDASIESLLLSTVPPASARLGLDLDLSQPIPANSFAALDDVVDVSDAEFFAQFDKDASDGLPPSDAASTALKKPDNDAGNLIDFNAFDTPSGSSEKFKRPKA